MPQQHPSQQLIRWRRMKCSASNVSALSFDLSRFQPSRRSRVPQPWKVLFYLPAVAFRDLHGIKKKNPLQSQVWWEIFIKADAAALIRSEEECKLEKQDGFSPTHTQVHAPFHPCWVATSKCESKKNYGAISRKRKPFPPFFSLVGAFRGKNSLLNIKYSLILAWKALIARLRFWWILEEISSAQMASY